MSEIKENVLTWKSVLYPHTWIGHRDRMRDLALSVGYPMFYWNGRIYDTPSGKLNNLNAEDIKDS